MRAVTQRRFIARALPPQAAYRSPALQAAAKGWAPHSNSRTFSLFVRQSRLALLNYASVALSLGATNAIVLPWSREDETDEGNYRGAEAREATLKLVSVRLRTRYAYKSFKSVRITLLTLTSWISVTVADTTKSISLSSFRLEWVCGEWLTQEKLTEDLSLSRWALRHIPCRV